MNKCHESCIRYREDLKEYSWGRGKKTPIHGRTRKYYSIALPDPCCSSNIVGNSLLFRGSAFGL